MVAPQAAQSLADFTASFGGQVVAPGDAEYDVARAVWNGMIDRRPSYVARCSGVADVIAAVAFAQANGLTIAVRGGGHAVSGHATCDEGMVIDLSPMKGIWVDPVAKTARVQAGVTWGELDRETQQFGLAVTGGRISTTGVSGLTLGSGSGWLERKLGLTADSLLSADIVTAAGDFLTASADSNPELFWGIRGGGGNFGIVTSFEFQLHEVGPIILGGLFLYPASRAQEVLPFYRDFMREAPEDLGSAIGFLTAPPEPFVPAHLQGQHVVGIIICYAGDLAEGERVIAPLRTFGPPDLDMVQPMPYTVLQSMLDAGNPPGLQGYFKAEFITELSDELIPVIIEECAKIESPLTVMLLEPLGGAMWRVGDDDTALGRPQAEYAYHALSLWPNPAENERHIAWTRNFAAAVAPYTVPGVYLNFIGDEEGEDRVRSTYGPAKYARLVALKDKYDPQNVFRLNQNVSPSS